MLNEEHFRYWNDDDGDDDDDRRGSTGRWNSNADNRPSKRSSSTIDASKGDESVVKETSTIAMIEIEHEETPVGRRSARSSIERGDLDH